MHVLLIFVINFSKRNTIARGTKYGRREIPEYLPQMIKLVRAIRKVSSSKNYDQNFVHQETQARLRGYTF